MKGLVPVIVAGMLLTISGCSTFSNLFETSPAPGQPAKWTHESPARQLEQARFLIRDGEDDAAHEVLSAISSGKSVAGVTDEALFHLSLLTLKDEGDSNGYPRTRQILDRLVKEYPHSLWGVEAASLNNLLMGRWLSEVSLGRAKRQVKTLKESNVSLTRENKELRLNIEKLKNLDLELEQKSRR